MRRPNGYATIVDPDLPLIEYDTASCCHCSRVIFVKPHTICTVFLVLDPQTRLWKEEAGAWCGCCMKPVCLPCHAKGTCTPLEKVLEQYECTARLEIR